ncbi:MAG: transposase [Bacteroidales bacterium]|nr:transposase [Bacteroidales bacterium]
MLTIFGKISVPQIRDFFSDEEKCLAFVADEKWKDGYVCRKCGHNNYCKGKTPHSRRCTRCKTEESATSHTIFHRCRINLTDAFRIAHLVCSKPNISSTELSKQVNIRQMTCWKFKKKISQCIEDRNDMSEIKKVRLKEIILGSRKK